MSATTMKAWQFTDPSHGLELKTVAIPEPGPNQVLVQVKAAGLCHTDYNVISGLDTTFMFKRPITLGHELAGIVTKTGSSVTTLAAGDGVVAVIAAKRPFKLHDAASMPGLGYDGGFGEYVILEEHKALRIPQGISFADAAVATDAVGTAYHAVFTAGQVKPQHKVAIVGLGGLGLCAAQLAASVIGAEVHAIDLDSKRFATALGFGVKRCAKSFAGLPGKRFDVILDFAGAGVTTSDAVTSIEQGGTIVLVGLGKKECTLNTFEFVLRNVVLKGATGASPDEIKACMDLIAAGKFKTTNEEIPFDGIAAGIDRLVEGGATARLWADPSRS
ncbi:hypothetical protein CKM354_001164600 [Cercospora kikuchii]|uniref:Enoyl reductase (ER) domain-containing protein n=1 Tax=Cercospora kikuchii TaxID=84275 RepID=A0A9P3CTE6_9PEZI|nr:uncharacterized protein CKM354_001164600 [Cercospora kikuchii]GIZ48593.1 hypothetical protein CKM354_001164600 [Cercospora kikuchii]